MVKEVIAVTNDKGGVGKTTTAQNLATGLTLKGYRVLIIDADAQLNASDCNGWNPKDERLGKRTLFNAMSSPSALPVWSSAGMESTLFSTILGESCCLRNGDMFTICSLPGV